jgi:hypothetical protein
LTFDGKHYSESLAATNSRLAAKNLAWQQQIILEAIIRSDSGVAVFILQDYITFQCVMLFLEKGSNYKLQLIILVHLILALSDLAPRSVYYETTNLVHKVIIYKN